MMEIEWAPLEPRYKIARLPYRFVLQLVMGELAKYEATTWPELIGVPAGAVAVHVWVDAERDAFAVKLWHPEFEIVSEGALIPEVETRWTIHKRVGA